MTPAVITPGLPPKIQIILDTNILDVNFVTSDTDVFNVIGLQSFAENYAVAVWKFLETFKFGLNERERSCYIC